MKTLILLAGLLLQGTALAQQKPADLDYTYVELRFVDVNSNGGDGFRINASYDLGNNWQIVGGLTSLDYDNNVDSTAFELGAGYVWHYTNNFDFFSTLRYVNSEIDSRVLNTDDDGLAFSAGTRGMLTPEFEIRGAVNHVTVGNSDTYLELAGDYYFTPQFAAGLSAEFAGDTNVFTVGARWFFN